MIEEIFSKYGYEKELDQLKNSKDSSKHADVWLEMIAEIGSNFDNLLRDLAIDNNFIGKGKYPFDIVYDSDNENPLMFFILINISSKKISPDILVDFAKKYSSEIVPILKLMPLEVIDFQTEMIIALAKDFDWEHYINKFDEYESRKNNQKFKELINIIKTDLFIDQNPSKTYKPATDEQLIKLLLLGLEFTVEEIRGILNYDFSLREDATYLLKDIYCSDKDLLKVTYPIQKPAHILKYDDLFKFKDFLNQIPDHDIVLQLSV